MMKGLSQIFEGYPIPVAEGHFNTSQTPPFIAWENIGSENKFADDSVWYSDDSLEVNLYSRKKDVSQEEKRLEKWMNDHSLTWERNFRVWDEKEKMYWSNYDVCIC